MIVHDFDLIGVIIPPDETDPPLVVDADALPPLQVALEGFEVILALSVSVLENMIGSERRRGSTRSFPGRGHELR